MSDHDGCLFNESKSLTRDLGLSASSAMRITPTSSLSITRQTSSMFWLTRDSIPNRFRMRLTTMLSRPVGASIDTAIDEMDLAPDGFSVASPFADTGCRPAGCGISIAAEVTCGVTFVRRLASQQDRLRHYASEARLRRHTWVPSEHTLKFSQRRTDVEPSPRYLALANSPFVIAASLLYH